MVNVEMVCAVDCFFTLTEIAQNTSELTGLFNILDIDIYVAGRMCGITKC